MPRIVFCSGGAEPVEIDAPEGMSVMQIAKANGIEGIDAECGGSAMCATCHVYVEAGYVDRLPPVGAVEEEMLECTASERKSNSRLSCQIRITQDLDGIIIRLPERQT